MLSRLKSMVAHYTSRDGSSTSTSTGSGRSSHRSNNEDDGEYYINGGHHQSNFHRGREVASGGMFGRHHNHNQRSTPPTPTPPMGMGHGATVALHYSQGSDAYATPSTTPTNANTNTSPMPAGNLASHHSPNKEIPFSTPSLDRTPPRSGGGRRRSASASTGTPGATPKPAASTPSSFTQSHFALNQAGIGVTGNGNGSVPFPSLSTPSSPNPGSMFGSTSASTSGGGSGGTTSNPSSPTIPGDFRTEIRYIETPRTQPSSSSSPSLPSLLPNPLTSSTSTSSPDSKRPSRKYLTDKVQALKDDKAALTTLLQGSQKKLGDLVSRNEGLTRTNQQYKADKERWSAEKSEMLERDRQREKDLRSLEETVRRQEGELRRMQDRARRLEERNGHLERLLGERTADLKGAQVFLTMADSYSGADVLKMVEDLNGEIFQLSASMAELLDNKQMMMASLEESGKAMATFNKEYQGTLVTRIGGELVGHLLNKRSQLRADPLPLQLAFQAFLAWWAVYMTERFCGGETGRDLVKLYGRVRSSEPQSVSGRWRAITIDKLKAWGTETHADFMTEAILTLLGICGWSRTGREAQSAILSIQAGVTSIAKLWTSLKSAMKEGVTTVDMQIFTYDPGDVFDPKLMEDAYGEAPGTRTGMERRSEGALARGGNRERERILCTIGVGLRRSVVRRTDSECYDQVDVSLKPKVALVSVLTVADRSDAMSIT